MNNVNTMNSRDAQDSWTLFTQDGARFAGSPFGYSGPVTGEVVFNTGMVGYPEALTDPSYRGQILVLTFPLIGNYGVSASNRDVHVKENQLGVYESPRIQISGLVVSEACLSHSHWDAVKSLSDWLREERVPALCGVDTRAVTKHLREKGSLLGGIGTDQLPKRCTGPESGKSGSAGQRARAGALRLRKQARACLSTAGAKPTSSGNFSSGTSQCSAFPGTTIFLASHSTAS